MRYKAIVYMALAGALLFGGCGLNESVMQKESKSFLWFTGNTTNAMVYIDNLAPINLDYQTVATNSEDGNNAQRIGQVHYEISPGKHSIVVKKSGLEVVNRNVLLGNGITKEIQIP